MALQIVDQLVNHSGRIVSGLLSYNLSVTGTAFRTSCPGVWFTNSTSLEAGAMAMWVRRGF